jgi:hypothetical protein
LLLLLLWLLLLLHNRAPRPQGDDATYRGLPLQFGGFHFQFFRVSF